MKNDDFKQRVEDFESRKELPEGYDTSANEVAADPAADLRTGVDRLESTKEIPEHFKDATPVAAAAAAGAATAAAGTAAAAAKAAVNHTVGADDTDANPSATSDLQEITALAGINKGALWALLLLVGFGVCALLFYAGRTSHYANLPKTAMTTTAPANTDDFYNGAYYNSAYLPNSATQPINVVYVDEEFLIPGTPQAIVPTPVVQMAQEAQTAPVAVAASQPDGNVVVYLFGNNVDKVSENPSLNELAAIAKRTGRDVVIRAYASPVGSAAYNQRLSDERARHVARYLQRHGVPASQIEAAGYGATNAYSTPAQDRRAVVTLQ